MTITYGWEITSLSTNPQPIGAISDVVVRVEYARTATDGENIIRDARVLTFDPDTLEAPFTSFEDLTMADVVGWIDAHEATQGIHTDADDVTTTSLDRTDAHLSDQLASMGADPEPQSLPWEAA